MTADRTPVVFIHGLWLHATSWAPWVELFRDAGYEPIAPGWPGDPETVEAARADPGALADHGIDEVTGHYARIIERLPAPPVLVGHSFGGMIAEKLLGEGYGAGAVAIDLYQRWVIPAPGRPLFEAAAANFQLHSPAKVNTRNQDRGPLLLVMGGRDHTVPEVITKATLKQYRHSDAISELTEFPDRGHSLTIDSGWRTVADQCLAWLDKQGL